MKLAICAVSAALLFGASGAAAQSRPDFSGRWTTQADPAAAARDTGAAARGGRAGGRGGAPPGDMGSGWGSTITITQDANRLTVEYMFFVRGDMQPPLRFVYALDGSETKNTVMMGRGVQLQMTRAAWDTDRLMLATLHTFNHPDTGQPVQSEVRRVLSLEAESLVVETTRAGVLGGPATTTRTVYRKLPS